MAKSLINLDDVEEQHHKFGLILQSFFQDSIEFLQSRGGESESDEQRVELTKAK